MGTLTRLRLLAVALAAVLGLAAAGCGGGGDGGGGAGPASAGARLVPASAAVLVTLDTDFQSDQWKAAEALVNRFPGGAKALDQLFASAGAQGLDLETDIKPAFGPETDVAVLDLAGDLQSADNAPIVLLTQPRDPAKLEALLAKGKDKAVFKVVEDGWYVVADNQAIIDKTLSDAAGASLADDAAYQAAAGSLPADSFARLYLNGPAVTSAFTAQLGSQLSGNPLLNGLNPAGAGKLVSAAVALSAQEQGFRIDGKVKTEGAPQAENFKAELPSAAPSGALVFASFSNLRPAVQQLLDLAGKQQPSFEQQLGQIEALLGISIQDDLLPIFEGEHALYVRPGTPIPEVTLLLSPPDPQKAVATLDKLTTVAALAGGAGSSSSFNATSVQVGGVQAKKLDFGGSFSLYYAAVGKNLVLTTAESGIADLASGATHLTDDPVFQEAKQAAGLGDESQGFVFVNVKDALPLLQSLGALGGASAAKSLDAQSLENLGALRYVLVSASGSGGETTFTGFAGIQ